MMGDYISIDSCQASGIDNGFFRQLLHMTEKRFIFTDTGIYCIKISYGSLKQ